VLDGFSDARRWARPKNRPSVGAELFLGNPGQWSRIAVFAE